MDSQNRYIEPENTLLDAMKQMDLISKKLLIVTKDNLFVGLISIGDIQRAIIKNKPFDTQIAEVLRENIKIANSDSTFDEIKQMMFKYRMELCPVVDNSNKIVKVFFWEDIFNDRNPEPLKKFNIPVVIMAGGFGSRLKPLTNVLPKPLIPIGDKTIIEDIFQKFSIHGSNTFYISVNYKADLIEYYIENQKLSYKTYFLKEEKPLGTAGSLSLLKDKINESFFVSNCDILINQDYSEILEYHLSNKNEITIVAALKHFSIAYGTIETGENGQLVKLIEKPELTLKINSGMYILEPNLLNEIPENQIFDITDLISKLQKEKRKVGVFPVSEKSWIDIGDWKEYLNNISKS